MQLYCKPVFFFIVVAAVISCSLTSCSIQRRTSVKDYPVDTPFVFDNKVILDTKAKGDEKRKLFLYLPTYWDDSLQTRKVQQFGFFYKLRNPPIFDSTAIARSEKFMNAYLNSQGYYYASFTDTFHIDTFKNQKRVSVTITAHTGNPTIIDSTGLELIDSSLQKIALEEKENSLLKEKETIFSKLVISNELDRLVTAFHNNGYYQFTRDNLIAEVDTTDPALIQLNLDPFEQAGTIAEVVDKRKKNPVATVMIKSRELVDTNAVHNDADHIKYKIGDINFYPETKFNEIPDSLMISPPYLLYSDTSGFKMYGNMGQFKFRPLREHTFMRRGNYYNEDNYLKTINNLSQIGAWQQVDVRTVLRSDSIDFNFFLTPAIKQNVTVDLEASRNTGDFLTVGNLFGLAVNTTYRNRNVWRRAIQSVTNFRNGVEFSFSSDNPLLQTLQTSLTHTYSFPRFIAPFKIKNRYKLDGIKTQFAVNGTYSERKDFFRLRSFTTNWGYEWKKKNKLWQYKPINIELYSLDTLSKLEEAFKTNPFLRNAFNTGSVVSQVLTFNVTYPGKHHTNQSNYIRLAVEEAGAIFARIKSLQDHIYQYIKFEGEYRKVFNYPQTSLALRAFGGVGYNYGNDARFGKTLPFFKQFIAGGPNSMRAWGLRQLGLGSSLLSDTAGTKGNAFRDRYGDLQLEANIEYRYRIAEIGTMKIDGALFTDIGNIWNIKTDTANPLSQFKFSRLGRDIAIGVGTGLRFDFDYFLIRIDGGIKLKDPARLENNGWLSISHFTWKNDEFERRDAKGEVISPNRNNYAIQLGIGLPF